VTVQFSRNFFFIATAFQRRLFKYITFKYKEQEVFYANFSLFSKKLIALKQQVITNNIGKRNVFEIQVNIILSHTYIKSNTQIIKKYKRPLYCNEAALLACI
ncbi:hypothetical protein, partial [Aneurinibacillus thermoaerophilus]|uniref:hypothetical protein n=2 Tax=Aneurinibacillus thermoaerophilus TaxID=143495 RepID=UPI002E1A6FDC|nr:hypothetical protein [Aneurinibacillus thermoaerophilus]